MVRSNLHKRAIAKASHDGTEALTQSERQVLIDNADLGKPGLKLCLMVVRMWEGLPEGIIPGYRLLASRMCCGRMTAIRCIEKLVEMGVVIKTVRHRDNKGSTTNRYEVDYAALSNFQIKDKASRKNQPASVRGGSQNGTPPSDQEGEGDPGINLVLPPSQIVTPPRIVLEPGGSQNGTPPVSNCDPIEHTNITLQSNSPTEQEPAGDVRGNIRGNIRGNVRGDVPDESLGGDVCLSDGALQIHNVGKAIKKLRDASVWSAEIGNLISRAGKSNGGNPLPRVIEVIDMAQKAKPKNPAAWLKRAIEEDWQPAPQGGMS